MTKNQRIVLNVVATYGRALFAMLCGVFTSRWVLASLGEQDYGLYGLIGGLLMFVTFVNGTLSAAIARYYAVSIGARMVSANPQEALEECRRWFSLAVFLHVFFPTLLLVVGYPLGVWAIEHWLTIPADRIDACLWVLRFASIASFVSMVEVPFSALYRAKQCIAELTVYSFLSTVANALFVLYMVNHDGKWLERYAFVMCLTAVIPQVLICLRAWHVFDEARFRLVYCKDWPRLRQIFRYAFWQMFGTLSMLLRCQALSIVTNKAFGPVYNSSMSIATVVNSHCGSLSASMLGAFSPAVMNEYGAGNRMRAHALSQKVCKYGAVFFLLFSLPLMIEMDYIIKLWLSNPPPWCSETCTLVLLGTIFEQMVAGTGAFVNATGRIRAFQVCSGIALLLTLPISIVLIVLTHNFLVMPLTILLVAGVYMAAKLYAAWHDAGFSVRMWLRTVFSPVLIVGLLGAIPGLAIVYFEPASFVRMLFSSSVTVFVVLGLAWALLVDVTERERVFSKLQTLKEKVGYGR